MVQTGSDGHAAVTSRANSRSTISSRASGSTRFATTASQLGVLGGQLGEGDFGRLGNFVRGAGRAE